MRPAATIIICARNAGERIGALVETIALQVREVALPVEIIVADSESSDGTARKAIAAGRGAGLDLSVAVLSSPGKVRALNEAVKTARGGILIFLDDDVRPQKNWLKNIISVFDQGCGLAGGKISAEWTDGPPPPWFTPAVASFTPVHGAVAEVFAYDPPFSSPVGANFAVKREIFEKTGLFSENLGHVGALPYGAEESELAFRAARAGFGAVYTGVAEVLHPFSRKTWTRAYLMRRAFYQGAGIARFLRGHGAAFSGNPWIGALRAKFTPEKALRGNDLAARQKRLAKSKNSLSGRGPFYFCLKTLLYAGYAYGCVFL